MPTRERLTSRERVLTAMRRQLPDRVPYDLTHGLTPPRLDKFQRETGQKDPWDYFGTDARTVYLGVTRVQNDYSPYVGEVPQRAYLDEWGIVHIPTDSPDPNLAHLEGYVYPMQNLKTAKEILDYPLPDLDADYRYESVAREIQQTHARDLAALGEMEMTVFEAYWYMRTLEQTVVDFVDNPELATAALDRIVPMREVQAQRYAELGADVIRLGDDMGTQQGPLMSLPMWQRWIKPYLARVIAAAKRARPDVLIYYHSCGNMQWLIPHLIEIGVDILNPVQPEVMNPAELKIKYGDRISFWGTIGTQRTLPFGTPEHVRREVKERIETVGVGGGLLIDPAHIVEPEVPLANLQAMVDAVKEYGYYD